MSYTETSKFTALILRHKPETIGITLDEHGRPVIYTIDSGRMSADGYDFFQSVNGVWLTKKVPPEYLHKNINDGF